MEFLRQNGWDHLRFVLPNRTILKKEQNFHRKSVTGMFWYLCFKWNFIKIFYLSYIKSAFVTLGKSTKNKEQMVAASVKRYLNWPIITYNSYENYLQTVLALKNGVWTRTGTRLFRTGKLASAASWLASRVSSSFMPVSHANWTNNVLSSVWVNVLGFVTKFMTSSWCLWNSLDLVYRNISGKQATSICIANAKHELLSIHSAYDI